MAGGGGGSIVARPRPEAASGGRPGPRPRPRPLPRGGIIYGCRHGKSIWIFLAILPKCNQAVFANETQLLCSQTLHLLSGAALLLADNARSIFQETWYAHANVNVRILRSTAAAGSHIYQLRRQTPCLDADMRMYGVIFITSHHDHDHGNNDPCQLQQLEETSVAPSCPSVHRYEEGG